MLKVYSFRIELENGSHEATHRSMEFLLFGELWDIMNTWSDEGGYTLKLLL